MIRRAAPLLGLLLLAPSSVRADEAGTCADAAESGQKVRDKGHFVEAYDLFARCARSECPKIIRQDCIGFLDQLRKRTPSVVVRVTDGAGHDLTEFRVLREGKVLLDKPSGTAVSTDPGPTTLHVEAPGYAPRDLKVVVAEGEQQRLIDVTLQPLGAPATPPDTKPLAPVGSSGGIGPATWVAGGVGVAGAGVFGIFQALAWSSYGDVKKRCGDAGKCTDADVDPIRTKYTVSAVGLGFGAAGLATAVVLYLAIDRGKHPAPSSSAASPASATSPASALVFSF